MRVLVPLVTAVLLVLPVAHAELRAASASYDQPSSLEGPLELLQLRTDVGGGAPWVSFEAADIEAVQYNSTYVVSDRGSPASYQTQGPTGTPYDLGVGRARLDASRGLYRLNLYAPSGMGLRAHADQGTLVATDGTDLSRGGLGLGGSDPTCADPRPNLGQFCRIERQGPILLHSTEGRSAEAVVYGDTLILELFGLDMAVDGERDMTLQSGRFPAAVAPVTGPVRQETEVFVRLILTAATVTLAADGEAMLEWAARKVTTHHEGSLTLNSAYGTAPGSEGIQLNGERYIAAAGLDFLLTPSSGGALEAEPAAASAPAATNAVPAAVTASAPFVLLAIAFLLVGLLALRLRPASLGAMEQAITQGRHRRAARLAARLLRRDPTQEDARLGRAIALTRSGRAARAIREVAAHLKRAEPSDGSLHYVLGLALLEKRRSSEARAALREAVRRTPELEADVRARAFDALPVASQPARASKEGVGYV
ncbi:MAG: tetratricopeptide repeat protein [Candidatus Thermoplasmatota archaeon]